jgi:hypothetical protein
MVCRSIAFLFFVLATGLAHAQTPAVTDQAKELVGAWEISNAQRDKRCGVAFSVDRVPNGFKLQLEPDCGTVFPPLKEIANWALGPDDVVRLQTAQGAIILEFSEVEGGLYEAERRGEGLYFMQTQAAIKAQTRTADQLFGEWRILREANKPLCSLTLSSAQSGPGNYRVVVKPGCDAAIAGFGLTAWRLDRDQLILAGRTGNWRFAESDPTTWERMPLTTNPMLLMKQ